MLIFKDNRGIKMDWAQVLTIVGSNIALILIMFGSTIMIWLHTDKKIEAIQAEIREFHGRLCSIEERNKK